MRIDARDNNYYNFTVYDAKRCRNVVNCVWVDSDTAQWGKLSLDKTRVAGETVTDTRQKDRISIYLDKQLVVFNEIEDQDEAIIEAELEVVHGQ